MIIIAAADNNNGIGNEGDLLFDIPEDKKFFKEKTYGNTVIMGRKTFESLPVKPLPGRRNIIFTQDSEFSEEGAETCRSVSELRKIISNTPDDKVFVIGGEQIYKLLSDLCDTAYITRIYSSKPADKHIMDFEENENWYIKERSELKEYQGIKFRFITFVKKQMTNLP